MLFHIVAIYVNPIRIRWDRLCENSFPNFSLMRGFHYWVRWNPQLRTNNPIKDRIQFSFEMCFKWLILFKITSTCWKNSLKIREKHFECFLFHFWPWEKPANEISKSTTFVTYLHFLYNLDFVLNWVICP